MRRSEFTLGFFSQQVCTRVLELRKEARLSQGDVAANAGISKGMVAHVESKWNSPTVGTIGTLATGLGVRPGDLLNVDRDESDDLGEIYELLRKHPGLVTRLKNALTLRT